MNIWFKHRDNVRPVNCDIPIEEATLDKYYFRELEKMQAKIQGNEPAEDEKDVVYGVFSSPNNYFLFLCKF